MCTKTKVQLQISICGFYEGYVQDYFLARRSDF